MSSFLAFFLLCILAAPASAGDLIKADCSDNMNYTRGSAFQTNLDALLAFLPGAAAASSGLFAKNVTGAAPDKVHGLAQCRADINASKCLACLDGSVQDLDTLCPGQKTALLIDDMCLIRFSNASFFDAIDAQALEVIRSYRNSINTTDPHFMSTLAELMGNVREKAAFESPRRFAVGSVELGPPLSNIFAMAQCTQDLSPDDCNLCLDTAVHYIPYCCDGSVGGRAYLRSCFIRFEPSSFYNAQDAEAAMSLPAPSPGGTGSKHALTTARLMLIIAAVTVLTVVLLLAALFLFKRNRKLHKHAMIPSVGHGKEEEMRTSESILYDLSTLRAATDNFSEENKLGEGGFGPVYKGVLENGQEIAVKRLSVTSQQGQVEMTNEVFLVAKLQHKNLVRILGCCIQEDERILVYEFLSNNSLDKILFDPARKHELSWGQKHKIIEGVGRGLLYLHEDSRLTIIHRDLKASNILLDGGMNPKISDFGLAKLFSVDSSTMMNTSRIAGTYGYMAPEYAMHGIFSVKSDVFSYGVLLLEIITGRRINTQLQGSEDLLTFVWRCWRCGSVGELLDSDDEHHQQPQEVLRCVHVGLLCVQEDPKLRPGMASVILMLKSRSITLPAPTAPAFAVVRAAIDALAESSLDDEAATRSSSINEASVSDMEPR